MRHHPSRSVALPLALGLASIGCGAVPTALTSQIVATEPAVHGEPLPGSFHLTSDPAEAPYSLIIRIDDLGGPSGRTALFEEGDPVVVDWSTLPLPPAKWIEVNGEDCDGTFAIQERIETDLRLILTDGACRVQILGLHPEGGPHLQPAE